MSTIHVVARWNNDSDDHTPDLVGAYPSEDDAYAGFASILRQAWLDQAHEDELPADDRAAVDAYYAFWNPEEGYLIKNFEVKHGS